MGCYSSWVANDLLWLLPPPLSRQCIPTNYECAPLSWLPHSLPCEAQLGPSWIIEQQPPPPHSQQYGGQEELDNLEDQAARLNQRALTLNNKGMKARIDKMLNARPDLHSGVIQHLVGMGCSDAGPVAGPAPELPPAAQRPKATLTEAAWEQLAARGSPFKQDSSKSSKPSSSTKSSTLGYPASMHGSQVAASRRRWPSSLGTRRGSRTMCQGAT